MRELIAIREAARRLGVSDTAVRKAIAAGRVKVAGKHETNGRPLLAWPDCERDWHANSDATKRTHVGSQGSAKREQYAGKEPAPAQVKVDDPDGIRVYLEGQPHGGALKRSEADKTPATIDNDGDPVLHNSMTLNEARTAKEIYAARQAKLDFEESIGKLIDAEQVRLSAFKMARGARDALLTLPDRLSPILASSTDVQEVHRLLLEDIDRICKRIADDAAKAAT